MRWTLFLLPVLLYSQIAEPRVGAIVAADGSARIMTGIAGAFVAGDTLADGATDAIYFGDLAFVKLSTSVKVGESLFEAPSGRAMFSLTRDGVFAWFPGSETLARVSAEGMVSIRLDTDVVAFSGPMLLVRRDDGLHWMRVRLVDGAVESDTKAGFEADLAVVLADGWVLYSIGENLMLRDGAGNVKRVLVPGAVTKLSLMSETWVHVRTETQDYAFRIRSGEPSLYELPESRQ